MKPTISLLLPVTLAAATLLAGCSERDAFAIADTSGDGAISSTEFQRFMLEAIFTEADADSDSKVTFAEHKAANPSVTEDRFKAIDADGDGAITPAEAKAFSVREGGLSELFTRIDTNKDRALSRSEVETFYTTVHEAEGSTKLEKLSNAATE